ncbi:MAG: LPS export ABC transporter permease LptG [Nitrospinae bacterium]|nr:LPS export ABC transporter permease LptG [Nitrospinota bacterium]MDA1109728.1 LPS export ABC transporter permease LptG [Nitrospinota bacterium]
MILKRYVLKTFLSFYLVSATGFVGVFLIGDFFERVDEFISRGAPMTDMILYYFYKIPFVTFYMAPQAVLLATVMTISSLAKTNEIIAMKACGVSITRITLPVIATSLVIALLVLASSEFITPKTSQQMNHIFYVKVRGGQTSIIHIEKEKIWYKSKTGSIWNIGQFDSDKLTLSNVSIFLTSENQFITQRIDADQAIWIDNQWQFMEGSIRSFGPKGLETTEFFEKRSFIVPEIPADFVIHKKRQEEMSVRNMYEEIKEDQSMGRDVVGKWVDFNYRLSYPFIAVVLSIIGIPLSLRSSRHGGLLFSVAINLASGVSFSFLYAMCLSLGRGGTFDPVLATWGPIVLFICMGFYLLLTIDSEKALPFLK